MRVVSQSTTKRRVLLLSVLSLVVVVAGLISYNLFGKQPVHAAVSTAVMWQPGTVTDVSVGKSNACAIADSGKAYCWGENAAGQLGIGTQSKTNYVTPVDTSTGLASRTVSTINMSGSNKICSIASGRVYCAGNNADGGLGNNSTIASTIPVTASNTGALAGRTATSLSIDPTHNTACAIADSLAFCWGKNDVGQLGDGTNISSNRPVAVDVSGVLGNKTVTSIESDIDYSCVIASGKVYCWGQNDNGQLGDGTTTPSNVPVAVDDSGVLSGKTVTQIILQQYGVCALADGKIYCWGYIPYGLGNGSTYSPTPVAVDDSGVLAGKTVTQIATTPTDDEICAVASGKAYCWGRNTWGQLGNNSTTPSLVPVAVDDSGVLAGKTVTSISLNWNHACAIASGKIYCWGSNSVGELGNGDTSGSQSEVPVAVIDSGVLAGKTIQKISVGESTTCALASGDVYCWGYGETGQLALGEGLGNPKYAPVSLHHYIFSIDSVEANKIAIGGSRLVRVIGSGFKAGATVNFGNDTANVISINDSFIDVEAPDIQTPSTVSVTVTNLDGTTLTLPSALQYVIVNKQVTGVAFATETGKQIMNITGTDFIDDAFQWQDGLAHSLVSLNGTPLPFCTDGTGFDAQSIVDDAGIDPSFVSDTPPCYYLFNSGFQPMINATSAKVWLPDEFDITAEGTVSVNDSPVFTFNAQEDPDTDPPVSDPGDTAGSGSSGGESDKQPPKSPAKNNNPSLSLEANEEDTPATITADDKSLTGTPEISSKPTFSGYAAPFSTVTVTVHSDPITCTTTADSAGYWTCTLPSELAEGKHTVNVKVVETDGTTTELGPYEVTVKKDQPSPIVTSDSETKDETGSATGFPWVWVAAGVGAFILILAVLIGLRRKAGE